MTPEQLRDQCAEAIIRFETRFPTVRDQRLHRKSPILTLVMKGRDVIGVRGTIVRRDPEGNVVVFNRKQVQRIRDAVDRAIALRDDDDPAGLVVTD